MVIRGTPFAYYPRTHNPSIERLIEGRISLLGADWFNLARSIFTRENRLEIEPISVAIARYPQIEMHP